MRSQFPPMYMPKNRENAPVQVLNQLNHSTNLLNKETLKIKIEQNIYLTSN